MKKITLLILFAFVSFYLFADEGFTDIFGDNEGSSQADSEAAEAGGIEITLSGNIGIDSTFYMDDSWDSQRDLWPFADLDLVVSSKSAEARIALNIATDSIDENMTMDDILDELSLRVFSPIAYFDLGLLKAEWGKGDGVHVVDPLNPIDQSSGISGDMNDMKKAELMVKANIYLGMNGLLEIVYKPFFHPYSAAASGRWRISDPAALPFPVASVPDGENGEYWQAAARITGSIGSVDLGALYYYGYMPEPGVYVDFMASETNIFYTQAHLAGVEAAAALGPFTLRTELGFWFTEDTDGDITHLYNNRFVWLGGIDFMIPGTTLFVSIQEFGQYILDYDGLTVIDVDKAISYDDKAYTNTVVAAVEGSFFKDVIKLRLSGMYVFETQSYMIMPAFFWYIDDNLELSVDGTIFGGEDMGNNPYFAWDENDNLGVSLHYIF